MRERFHQQRRNGPKCRPDRPADLLGPDQLSSPGRLRQRSLWDSGRREQQEPVEVSDLRDMDVDFRNRVTRAFPEHFMPIRV